LLVAGASGRAPVVPRSVMRAAVSGLCAGATSGLVRLTFRLVQDGRSPWLIGAASDQVGLRTPVLITGCLLAVAGAVLLAGRATLEVDLRAASTPVAAPRRTR